MHLADLVDLEGMEAREREALETLLGREVEDVRRAARDEARMTVGYLRSYGVALVKAGRLEETKRLVAYLIAQPGAEHNLTGEFYPTFYGAKERGEPLSPAASPWDVEPTKTATPERRR